MAARRCPNCECIAGPLTVFKGCVVCEFCRASLAAKGQRYCKTHGVVKLMSTGRCALCRLARARAVRSQQQAQQQAWRDANRERLRARQQAWRDRNRERVRAQQRATARWRRANPTTAARLRELSRAYHQRNRERLVGDMRLRARRRLLRILKGAAQ